MKQFKNIMTIIILSLLALFLFHSLNALYPGNIIEKTFSGLSLVVTPVLIALILVYLLNPLTDKFITKFKIKKSVAILLTITLIILFTAAIVLFSVFFLIDQSKSFIETISRPEFLNEVEFWFVDNNLGEVYAYIYDLVSNFDYSSLLGSASNLIGVIIQTVTVIVLVPIFLWHFLNSKETMLNSIDENIPKSWQKHVMPIAIKSNYLVASYFKSKIISMIVLFFMFVVVYLVLGLPIGYVILFSVLIAVLDLIPYLGPTTGLLIPIIYIFSVGHVNLFYINNLELSALWGNIILIVLNTVIQFIQGNIVIPKLAGDEMGIHSALILVFMLFFGSILGVWGIILSIPLGGIIMVIWKHIRTELLDKVKE
ncbi:AI-2E family transporter [Acholeplasma granularum]|uniref:AI-2E family transporter n=1 Tax=Acholeplasma granularum TaxID=264635 RepID=UPI00046EC22C|nr:AI-2E family transporter [Acholeplasma granularum]